MRLGDGAHVRVTPEVCYVKPAHYRGSYHVRARQLRQAANANPATTCWRCGEPARPGDPWQAGHLHDADPHSPLLPEHRSCNARAGAILGNAAREPRSRAWGGT